MIFHQDMNTIKNLLFDFGGVLVDLDMQRCSRAFRSLGIDVSQFLHSYRQEGTFLEFERGNVSFAQCCQEIRDTQHVPHVTDQQMAWAWNAFLLDVPVERLEFLLRLKSRYRLFLLSNTNHIHWQLAEDIYFRHKGLQIGDFFEQCFLSFRLHLDKPAPQIFHAVAQQGGIEPEETLFFDDSEKNCEAARQCGFQALTAPLEGGWMNFFDSELNLCK